MATKSKGRGKAKGKQSTDERTLEQRIVDALPVAAYSRSKPQLLPGEWSVPTRSVQTMSSAPGICIAYESEIPDLLVAVGTTSSA
eukprot:2861247-Amphidinium_carterae.1